MGLADRVKLLEAEKPHQIKKEGLCHAANLFSYLPPKDLETLKDLLKRGFSTRVIVHLLTEEGYKIGPERFNDHRHNRCICKNKESE